MNTSDLDDLAPVIGYRATRVIAAWFAGRDLHTPARSWPGHPLAKLIGQPAFDALVREYPSERFRIPTNEDDDRCRRDRVVAERLVAGRSCVEIADELGLTVRRVEQLRFELVDQGVLEYAQGFDSAMQAGRGNRLSRNVAPPRFANFGTGEVSGEPPPPVDARLAHAGAMGALTVP